MAKKKARKYNHNRELGKRGEIAAARYLEHMGYDIIEQNWSCPAGEADIIAFDGYDLVFVEVKTRTSFDKGFPSEAVDEKKRRRYERIAGWYLMETDFSEVSVRFDIIALIVVSRDRAFMRHYQNAFACGW